MDINCVHFDRCSGCDLNTNIEILQVYEEAKIFFLDRKILLSPLHIGKITGWRTRAKLAVRGTSLIPLIGLYEKKSHKIVDIPFCRVHHPQINHVVEIVKTWIKQNNITIYEEDSGKGLLRYVQCSVERKTGKIQLVVVVNKIDKSFISLLKNFYTQETACLHSVWINVNHKRDNVIFGNQWELIAGEKDFWEQICGVDVCFHPACFSQANMEMYEQLIEQIKNWVPKERSVLEMYAGVGVIGLCLAEQSKQVTCVEKSSQARACFEASCQHLSKDIQNRINLNVASAGDQVHLLEEEFTTLVVDPPRKGLDSKLLLAIEKKSFLKELVYVSCGWESFKRDCDQLCAIGWKLEKAEAYLFFPGTEHLELLSLFTRK